MTDTYIILSESGDKIDLHDVTSCLGHELHLSRIVLFNLLYKNLINKDATIVTIAEDRFFLYNKTFTRVITWENYRDNFKNKPKTEIDLTYFMLKCFGHTNQKEMNEKYLNGDTYNKSDNLINYLNNINFSYSLDSNFTSQGFAVVHFRHVNGCENNKEKLIKIINKLKQFNIKIVVFCFIDLNIQIEGVLFINNLQLYASYLNNANCNLLISEWSGAGQLSQYCFNKKIVYYFDAYDSIDYVKNYSEIQNICDNSNTIFACWDFKHTISCERFYFKTLENALDAIQNVL
jgi:hypothetical protein